MKTKLLFFLAMLLMGSMSAFAQSGTSTPLKGDLNEDGKVDAADIVILVDLVMKSGEESGGDKDAKYFWYAGTTIPTAENIASIATGSSDSKPNWTESEPYSVAATNTTESSAYIYYCFPAEWNVTILDSDKISEVKLDDEEGNRDFTYNGIKYQVQRTGRTISPGTKKEYWAKTSASYYWYAGPEMLTSETVPGTNADNECGYGWHTIEGNPTSIETGELGTSDCEKINWVLAVPTKFGLNAISNGEDITDAYDVSTVTTADGVQYMVFTQINPTKKTDIIFVKGNGSTSETKYYYYVGRQPVSGGIGTTDFINTNTSDFLASPSKIEKNSIDEVKSAVTGLIDIGSIDDGDAILILPTEVANAITSIKNPIDFDIIFDKAASVNGYTCVFIGDYTLTEIKVVF